MKGKFISKIFKFFSALLIWGIHGFKLPERDVLKTRVDTCLKCDNWKRNLYGPIGGCSVCGCSKIKLYLKTEYCPLKKW